MLRAYSNPYPPRNFCARHNTWQTTQTDADLLQSGLSLFKCLKDKLVGIPGIFGEGFDPRHKIPRITKTDADFHE